MDEADRGQGHLTPGFIAGSTHSPGYALVSGVSVQRRKMARLMKTSHEVPAGDTPQFELLSVSLHAEGHVEMAVRLPVPGEAESAPQTAPFVLKEGAEIRVTLIFRIGKRPVEGLKFVEERKRHGSGIATSEVLLGSYRPGGPYEVVLPAEHLPTGHLARDTYQVTGTFVDTDGHVLGRETHSFEIAKAWD
ncbi:hypothetical protein [Streptomyces sannanensis]|uniref:hypothetical protein n=1 Tax=Streptomyces sannanensis TaxID=285536 RepID=UPI0031E5970C